MFFIKPILLTLLFLFSFSSAQDQSKSNAKLVDGPCEGCEAIFEYGERELSPVDTLIDFFEDGPKLKLIGTVYQSDGKTPASDVILYIYHTNQEGIYPTLGDETGWASRHGYIRGWIKTDEQGKYTFYTLRPGTYPSHSEPAHIHITVLEPDGKYYWISSYHFADDPLLSVKERSANRGGPGIMHLIREDGLLVGKRDIFLGLNVPGY